MNSNSKRRLTIQSQQHRDGITLLFVISLVVLFLLMGTTFVIVSNDYFKAARRRSLVTSNVFDNEKFLDSAFYQLLRDVPLNDSTSPIRFHSILADQYGYGQKGQVQNLTVQTTDFVKITIGANSADPDPLDTTQSFRFFRMRVPGAAVVLRTDKAYFDGVLNGQVFSITSGPLAGESRRIVDHELNQPVPDPGHPHQDTLTITVQRGTTDWSAIQHGDEVVINGRDFGGYGFGDARDLIGDASDLNWDDFDVTTTEERLADTAPITSPIHPLHVNQTGVPYATKAPFLSTIEYSNGIGTGTQLEPASGFVATDGSPNEAYDAPDFQNMFLSGFDANNNIIPSFHRDRLYQYAYDQINASGTPTPSLLRKFTFRPVMMSFDGTGTIPDDNVVSGSSSNAAPFIENQTGALANAINSEDGLDVDTDGDGKKDAVWIDIGLPTQTTTAGDTFRPLVAYRVIDMDSKLNVNAHGSHVDQAQRSRGATPSRRGSGYGVAEISLSGITSSNADYLSLLSGRENSSLTAGARAIREQEKLTGYITGGNANVLGGLFATGSNFFGQHIFQANSGAPTEMPGFGPALGTAETLTPSELINPYITDFSIDGRAGDDLYRAAELEPLLRPYDSDSGLIPSRLKQVIADAQVGNITTASFDISLPTATLPLSQRLNIILEQNGVATQDDRETFIEELLPTEVFLGRKLNLNREILNLADAQRLARDIYITMLLACGDRAPDDFTAGGSTLPAGHAPDTSEKDINDKDEP